MAFFISGYPSRMMPVYYDGGNLGLLSETTADGDGDAGHGNYVAVEFDTFKNSWDPSGNHIGIHINSVVSSNTTDLEAKGLPALNGTMTATITFDNITRMLVASLLFHDRPSVEPVVVSYVLQDPRSLLPRQVAVGFSAATGRLTELHQILAWSFTLAVAAPPPNSTTLTPPAPNKGRKSTVMVIAVVAPIVALFICGIVSFKFIKWRRKGKGKMDVKEEDEALGWVVGRNSEFIVYDFVEVLEATDNFSEENKLGQGGFGPVYKGQFHDGLQIAVKRLASHSG